MIKLIFGQFFVLFSLLLVSLFNYGDPFVFIEARFPDFLYYWLVFLIVSLVFDKYNFAGKRRLKVLLFSVVKSNLVYAALVSFYLMLANDLALPRTLFLGSLAVTTFLELTAALITGIIYETRKKDFTYENHAQKTPTTGELKHTTAAGAPAATAEPATDTLPDTTIQSSILEEIKAEALDHLKKYITLGPSCMIISSNSRLNVLSYPSDNIQTILNLQRVNNHRYVNKFFEAVNEKLPMGGFYAGLADTRELRKKRFLKRFTPFLGYLLYIFDFIFNRVIPKIPVVRKIYFSITKGRNRIMSRAEVLGRLYSCGFKVVNEKYIGDLLYFVVRKNGQPVFDNMPTYGPLVRLRRIGKNQKTIGVYKMRTMHPYSEYIQEYIYNNNHVQKGGKIANDYRVTSWGRIMRKLWIDELPMFINLVKGDLKLFGVRPLSMHMFSTYPEHLQKLRTRYKPGLVPPFYADLPTTEEEIYHSEEKYLRAYRRSPFKTDFVYFFKAFYNIVFKKARSN